MAGLVQDETGRWAGATKDHTRCHCCHLGQEAEDTMGSEELDNGRDSCGLMSLVFFQQHSDSRVRIWRKQHDIIDPFNLGSTIHACGVEVILDGCFGQCFFFFSVSLLTLSATSFAVTLLPSS